MEMEMVKLVKYDLEGNFLELLEGNSVLEICKLKKIPQGSIYQHLKGTILTCGNFQYREISKGCRALSKIGSVWNLSEGHKSSRCKVIKRYKGEIISIYDTIEEASVKNRVNPSNIVQACKGVRNKIGGFEWEYSSEKRKRL